MDCTSTQLSYGETGYFSNIVSSYISGDEQLRQFYKHAPNLEGLQQAMAERSRFTTDRQLLVSELREQYKGLPADEKVHASIDALLSENSFVVTTAHQPAIFTGNLFFIYKIIHAIKLAEYLSTKFPDKQFVPVYYMGSEDADLDELGHIFMNGEKIAWETQQKGAVGRMSTKGLDKVIHRIEGELLVQPFGEELMKFLRECYLDCPDIQTATLKLVHHLFGRFGLVVFIPDRAAFKKKMLPVFEDDLFNNRAVTIVEKTIAEIGENFKVQAHPRPINLFYLQGSIRQRIERTEDGFVVMDTDLRFTVDEMRKELQSHPERFSPNVILRGLMQETLLPGIAFIGGGGEIAYWLELRKVFELYKVPYPVLVIRNSFLVVEEKWKHKLNNLQISVADIFRDEQELMNGLVKRQSSKQLSLAGEITHVNSYYDKLKSVAGEVDDTLTVHVAALQTRAIKPLHELEKKLLRAEKRKFEIEARHLSAIKQALFPNNNLQERVDNFLPYYAKWGRLFIDRVYDYSSPLDQKFTVLNCR
jgi:bacillithiol biosynthesis cysteine-adding enzyme BshC